MSPPRRLGPVCATTRRQSRCSCCYHVKMRSPELPQPRAPRPKAKPCRPQKNLFLVVWRNRSGFPQRSRAETKMNCINRWSAAKLLGQRLMGPGFDRQIAEVRVHIDVMNT